MKKLLAIPLLFLLAAIVAYGVWVQTPSIENHQLYEASMSAAASRWDALQAQANDAEKNSFIDPAFLPAWGRKDKEFKEGSPPLQAMAAWVDYSTTGSQAAVDHKALAKDPEYLAALAGFEKLQPALETAMRRPIFTVNDTPRPNLYTLIPNLIQVRGFGFGAIGLAEARSAQGRHSEAAHLIGSTALFGRALGNGTGLLQDMIGIAVQKTAAEGYVGLLDPTVPLGAAGWKALAADMVAAVPPVDQSLHSMQGELWNSVDSLETLKDPADAYEGEPSAAARLPGWMAREQRIFTNLMVATIGALQETGVPTYPPALENPSPNAYFTGKVGTIATILIPNFGRANEQYSYTRKLMTGLALVSGVRAYQAERGKLPTSVEEIKAAGIATPDPSSLAKDGIKFTSDGKKVTISADFVLPETADWALSKHFKIPAWAAKSTNSTLVFEVLARS